MTIRSMRWMNGSSGGCPACSRCNLGKESLRATVDVAQAFMNTPAAAAGPLLDLLSVANHEIECSLRASKKRSKLSIRGGG